MRSAALLLALFTSIIQAGPTKDTTGTCFFTPGFRWGFCDFGNSEGDACPESAPCLAKDHGCYVENGGVLCQ
ncbi:hypothetical protein Tdes44962_MAKER02928 [Teratosphaeria destructans]|uniref:Uncharacterized protein n=1 Tax=Teratosphaeria destructans TaxID=418781 RepID=A0A9W7W1Y6_9PEZI|nr:hypothetical protein Tdes44962_MAKER02928 [Teratosphaeria destructans]